jgi:hypothetical protein
LSPIRHLQTTRHYPAVSAESAAATAAAERAGYATSILKVPAIAMNLVCRLWRLLDGFGRVDHLGDDVAPPLPQIAVSLDDGAITVQQAMELFRSKRDDCISRVFPTRALGA